VITSYLHIVFKFINNFTFSLHPQKQPNTEKEAIPFNDKGIPYPFPMEYDPMEEHGHVEFCKLNTNYSVIHSNFCLMISDGMHEIQSRQKPTGSKGKECMWAEYYCGPLHWVALESRRPYPSGQHILMCDPWD
jgi:hypothetical protein